MTNTTDRIIYVHKESKMYITHTHYMELMTGGRKNGIFPELVINVPQRITPSKLPMDIANVLDKPKVDRYTYLIERIPYDPDWEVEILPEFTKDELYTLAYHARINSSNIMDALNKKFEVEFHKTLERESEMYKELNIR